jgi:hypothetical protein
VQEPLPEKISGIVNSEFETLLPKSQPLGDWNDSFLASHKTSVPHVQAALTARLLLKPESKSQCEKDLVSTLDLEDASLEKAIAGLDLLDEWRSSAAAKQAYVEKAYQKWSEASAFQPPK